MPGTNPIVPLLESLLGKHVNLWAKPQMMGPFNGKLEKHEEFEQVWVMYLPESKGDPRQGVPPMKATTVFIIEAEIWAVSEQSAAGSKPVVSLLS